MFISFKEQNFCNGVTIDEVLDHLCDGYNHEKMKIWPRRPSYREVTDPKSGMDTKVRHEHEKNSELILITN